MATRREEVVEVVVVTEAIRAGIRASKVVTAADSATAARGKRRGILVVVVVVEAHPTSATSYFPELSATTLWVVSNVLWVLVSHRIASFIASLAPWAFPFVSYFGFVICIRRWISPSFPVTCFTDFVPIFHRWCIPSYPSSITLHSCLDFPRFFLRPSWWGASTRVCCQSNCTTSSSTGRWSAWCPFCRLTWGRWGWRQIKSPSFTASCPSSDSSADPSRVRQLLRKGSEIRWDKPVPRGHLWFDDMTDGRTWSLKILLIRTPVGAHNFHNVHQILIFCQVSFIENKGRFNRFQSSFFILFFLFVFISHRFYIVFAFLSNLKEDNHTDQLTNTVTDWVHATHGDRPGF